MKLRTINGQNFRSKRVLIRTDYNVPLQDGKIQDATRIEESLPTLRFLIEQGAKIIIMSHLGRPKNGSTPEFRLDPIAKMLSELLEKPVRKLDECVGQEVQSAVFEMKEGEIIMLENLRFHPEEEKNDPEFCKALASLGEAYISDAFGTVHRAHASTFGVAKLVPAFAGFLIEKEFEVLSKLLQAPEHPVCLIAGGAKVDTKIGILEKFLPIADIFILGGALANTFLKASGQDIGTSLYEHEKLETARKFLQAAAGKMVLLPIDAAYSDENQNSAKILDIGPKTIELYSNAIKKAKTIIWNGPMGLYELNAFAKGTAALAKAISESSAYSVLGGGDTIDAIHNFGFSGKEFSHISTGGGAMLEFLEGKVLPGIEVLSELRR